MNTLYEYKIRSRCGNNYSNFSPLSTFTTLNCASYGNNSSEWIDLFSLGSINRSSGADAGGYINTGLSTSLVIGSSVNAGQISAGFSGNVRSQNYSVYIDFNRNGNFADAGERVFGTGYINSAGTFNFNVVIPATATPGPANMRVVMRRASNGSVSACLTGFLGETEDYTVNLVSSLRGMEFPVTTSELLQNKILIGPNPSNGIFTVTLPEDANMLSYEVINTSGIIVQKGIVQKTKMFSIDISSLSKGLYILKLTGPMGILRVEKLIKN